jgi:hypothetical protein
MGKTKMAIVNAAHGKLLLTADLLQRDSQFGLPSRKLDDGSFGLLRRRFPPIEDLVTALDHTASREIAA